MNFSPQRKRSPPLKELENRGSYEAKENFFFLEKEKKDPQSLPLISMTDFQKKKIKVDKNELESILETIKCLEIRLKNLESHQAQVNFEMASIKASKESLENYVKSLLLVDNSSSDEEKNYQNPENNFLGDYEMEEEQPEKLKKGENSHIFQFNQQEEEKDVPVENGEFSTQFYNQIVNTDFDLELFDETEN